MPTTCFCYTVDRHYALPTVLSAIQARAHLSPAKADVLILFIGTNDAAARALTEVCSRHGILFQLVAPAAIDNLPPNFARHFLDRLLDANYVDVMHVDGDTQIIASLDPVIDAPLQTGRILAVPDPMAVMIDAPGRAWSARRHYFDSIGIGGERSGRYVNSGVFRAKRSDIGAIGRECLRICMTQKEKLVFGEQDALNIAFNQDICLISFKWNFPVFFLNFDYGLMNPRIYHFMSNPRPWQGNFRPWGPEAHNAYASLISSNPELIPLLQPFGRVATARYWMQQFYKRMIEPLSWNTALAKARVIELELQAAV